MKKPRHSPFNIYQIRVLRSLIILLLPFSVGPTYVYAQDSMLTKTTERSECQQEKQVRHGLIEKAEIDQYNVLYVEFLGNSRLSGRDLFKRTKPFVDEGDIFTKKNLESAVKSVSKIPGIYLVSMDNVVVRLDEADRSINILFCISEKSKK